MDTLWRTPSPDELRKYAYQLKAMVDNAEGWQGKYEPEDALATLDKGFLKAAVINNTHLFLYVIASPWYNAGIVQLLEVGIYRVERGEGGKGNGFAGIVKAMEDIARHCGASRVVVGTSLPKNKEALVRLYKTQGFKVNAYELIKEI